jgi:hypothetical protein
LKALLLLIAMSAAAHPKGFPSGYPPTPDGYTFESIERYSMGPPIGYAPVLGRWRITFKDGIAKYNQEDMRIVLRVGYGPAGEIFDVSRGTRTSVGNYHRRTGRLEFRGRAYRIRPRLP